MVSSIWSARSATGSVASSLWSIAEMDESDEQPESSARSPSPTRLRLLAPDAGELLETGESGVRGASLGAVDLRFRLDATDGGEGCSADAFSAFTLMLWRRSRKRLDTCRDSSRGHRSEGCTSIWNR